MRIIDDVTIENLRGIEKFSFQTNSINIIVGRNNTGKSAILQALSLILTATNSFKDRLGKNILRYLITEKKIWLSIFS